MMGIEIKTPVPLFLQKVSIFLDNCGIDPVSGSPAEMEIRDFSRTESIFYWVSGFFIAANDYLKALDTLVAHKAYSFAPWSYARGLIEAATICTWLLEKSIDSKERVSRSLSLRYTSLTQQIKLARYDGDNALIKKITTRIDDIEETTVVGLGYKLIRDRKNRRIGIGQKKPSITSLVEQQFGQEKLYRILSGMAHSTYTTLTSLSFTKENLERKSGAVIREAVPITFQEMLVSEAAKIYVKCLWLKTTQYGFDAAKAAVLFEELYDELKLSDQNNNRFWRTIIQNHADKTSKNTSHHFRQPSEWQHGVEQNRIPSCGSWLSHC